MALTMAAEVASKVMCCCCKKEIDVRLTGNRFNHEWDSTHVWQPPIDNTYQTSHPSSTKIYRTSAYFYLSFCFELHPIHRQPWDPLPGCSLAYASPFWAQCYELRHSPLHTPIYTRFLPRLWQCRHPTDDGRRGRAAAVSDGAATMNLPKSDDIAMMTTTIGTKRLG